MNDTPFDVWKSQKTRVGTNTAEFLPTWQIGQAQAFPNNVRNYFEEGYGKNSLIYSCIVQKATSFATLDPIVIRSDGKVAPTHRMVTLLANPNEHQDGQDLAELLMTQYEAAGNVYVHKIRTPRPGFEGFPVTALELIRPDYVTIEPGSNALLDVFVVTVGGRVVRRISRADMIHIHEPSLVNDFYGMSKIAVLVTEGNVDSEMTKFESAFFNNAGVPMGIIKTKGSKTPEQRNEIKSRFREAFSGFKNWFNVLVLNMDETEYVQLGMKQSDMEMDSTRYHVESRICAVFGIPGVIVGARFAMSGGGTTTTYEDAEHAFWAETMVPDSMKIARAYQKHLLPEFATTRDRNATVSYDFTQVRALQEDKSRKLREVTRLVLTGGFTVNQALTVVGLPKVDDGDFYIRQQSTVTVDQKTGDITPMGGSSTKAPANPLEGAALLTEQIEGILRGVGE